MSESKLTGLLARRWASPLACRDVREELASAPGALERLRLRRHVGSCPSCGAFQGEVRRQRGMLALALPVVPSFGLKASTLAAVGIGAGGGGAAGGGLAALIGGKISAKLAAAALVAGGAAAGGGVALVETPERDAGRAEHGSVQPREQGTPGGPKRSGGPGALAGAPVASGPGERAERKRRAERRRLQRAPQARAERESSGRGHTERGREWAKTRGRGHKRGLYKPRPPTAPKRERSKVPRVNLPRLDKRERSLAPPRVKVPKAPKEVKTPK